MGRAGLRHARRVWRVACHAPAGGVERLILRCVSGLDPARCLIIWGRLVCCCFRTQSQDDVRQVASRGARRAFCLATLFGGYVHSSPPSATTHSCIAAMLHPPARQMRPPSCIPFEVYRCTGDVVVSSRTEVLASIGWPVRARTRSFRLAPQSKNHGNPSAERRPRGGVPWAGHGSSPPPSSRRWGAMVKYPFRTT